MTNESKSFVVRVVVCTIQQSAHCDILMLKTSLIAATTSLVMGTSGASYPLVPVVVDYESQ